MVHTLLHLDKRADRLFQNLTQQAASKILARQGWNWCGMPRLGPHAMRTYNCCSAYNNPEVTIADHAALASHMQVSVDTMNAVYAASSLRDPAAQLAFKLHVDENDENAEPDVERQQRKKQKAMPAEVYANQQILNQIQQRMQQQQQQHEQQMLTIQSLSYSRPV
jgi:hypothetical protein